MYDKISTTSPTVGLDLASKSGSLQREISAQREILNLGTLFMLGYQKLLKAVRWRPASMPDNMNAKDSFHLLFPVESDLIPWIRLQLMGNTKSMLVLKVVAGVKDALLKTSIRFRLGGVINSGRKQVVTIRDKNLLDAKTNLGGHCRYRSSRSARRIASPLSPCLMNASPTTP